jgi:hypothetical protein
MKGIGPITPYSNFRLTFDSIEWDIGTCYSSGGNSYKWLLTPAMNGSSFDVGPSCTSWIYGLAAPFQFWGNTTCAGVATDSSQNIQMGLTANGMRVRGPGFSAYVACEDFEDGVVVANGITAFGEVSDGVETVISPGRNGTVTIEGLAYS